MSAGRPELRSERATLGHSDGPLEEARAPWLIDAEGVHSAVRTTLDLPFEGKTLEEQFALGDLHIDGDLAETDFHIFASEHGFMALFPMGGRRFRLIVSDPIKDDPKTDKAPTLDELQATYGQRSHIPARLGEMTWSSWFHINSRKITRLKVGRLLLGGDAAHIHSPAGAQGMNTGIQDMINLAWKLALVIKGEAPEALLDTYEQDRLPVIRSVLTNTERITSLIGSESPIARGLFNVLAPWVGGAAIVQEDGTSWMSQVAVDYRHGPLSEDHGHGGDLHAGDRVPDMLVRRLGGGADLGPDRALYTVLDPSRFVLLVTHPEAAASPAAEWRDVVRPWVRLIDVYDLAPARDATAAARFGKSFGRVAGLFPGTSRRLRGIRQQSTHGAARHLDARTVDSWLAAPDRSHSG